MTANRLSVDRKKKNFGLRAFLFGIILSGIIFLPFLIYDSGLFLYYGDFNVQQIPFYQLIHHNVRTGNMGWSNTTDLGVNVIGSYSFYLLGSPFFWLTIPFPNEVVPYLMAPLLVLKCGCASFAAYLFLRRYVRNKNFAVFGGILYAFSSFSIYNIFFNHFHEPMIMFPLLLAAIDEYMYTQRRGIVALAVFGACVVNYYFFVGQVLFVIIYWVLRVVTKSYKISAKKFFILAFEVLIGFFATAVLLVPSMLAVIQNPRVEESLEGWNAIVYSWPQRYVHLIQSMFFPPDIPARPNFTPDSNAKWSSLAAWLPLVGMTGVIGYLQSVKYNNWLKRIIFILIVMTFIPILNSLFQMLNSAFYTRWFYMLTLMMSLATIIALERHDKVNWKRAFCWSGGITAFVAVIIGFMRWTTENEDGETVTEYGLMEYDDRFWGYVAIAMICLAAFALLIRVLKRDKRTFLKRGFAVLSVVVVLYSIFILCLGKAQGYNSHSYMIPYVINKEDEIDLPNSDNVRTDFFNCMDNLAMYYKLPTIQAFHSIVPGSIMQFYPDVGVTRDVGSRPETNYYALRSLLSVRWLLDYNGDDSFFAPDGVTEMPSWTYYNTQNGYDVYENNCYIPMGFTYDNFISEEDFYDCQSYDRQLLLLKALVLSNEDLEEHNDILENKKKEEDYKGLSDYFYSQQNYLLDCQERKSGSCYEFEYGVNCFNAKISIEDENDDLVFFSVPYEDGWKAYVNGESVEIIKANVGFMAVRVPGGTDSEIYFEYETPGLKSGLLITGLSVLIFGGYMVFFRKKQLPEKQVVTYRIKYQ